MLNNLETDVWFDGNEIQLKRQKAIATLPDQPQLVIKIKYFEEFR